MSNTVDKAVAWDAISEKNAEIARLRSALKEAERFMSYFANETGGHFVGPGTPETCLAQIRAALWVEKPPNPPPGLTEHELDRDEAIDSIGWFG